MYILTQITSSLKYFSEKIVLEDSNADFTRIVLHQLDEMQCAR